MKFLSPTIHGIADYVLVFFLLASPKLFEMEPKAANFTYALAVVHFILTLITDFKPGVARVVPFSMHGVIELMVGIGLIITAYSYFGTDELASRYYLWLGVFILIVWLITRYEKPKTPRRPSVS